MPFSNHLTPLNTFITQKDRNQLMGHPSFAIWLTGLSGSGKSTIANHLENYLYNKGYHTYILDGDNTRKSLSADLGFGENDRLEHLRRMAHIAQLMVSAGIIPICAFISPLEIQRKLIKGIIGAPHFVLTYVDTPLSLCEERDVKGLYQKARMGQIKDFTGVSAPFEIPENADITISTLNQTPKESVQEIINYLNQRYRLSL